MPDQFPNYKCLLLFFFFLSFNCNHWFSLAGDEPLLDRSETSNCHADPDNVSVHFWINHSSGWMEVSMNLQWTPPVFFAHVFSRLPVVTYRYIISSLQVFGFITFLALWIVNSRIYHFRFYNFNLCPFGYCWFFFAFLGEKTPKLIFFKKRSSIF